MLIALDVAFSNIGWTAYEDKRPVACGVIKTEKTKKKSVRVSDDNAHRCALASRQLKEIIERYGARGIIGELPGGSQSAKAAAQLGMATAIVSTVASLLELPAEWCTPDEVKQATVGKKNAGKAEIMDHVIGLYGGEKDEKRIQIKKGKRAGKESVLVNYTFLGETFPGGTFEHIADSCGAYLALQDGNMVRMFG